MKDITDDPYGNPKFSTDFHKIFISIILSKKIDIVIGYTFRPVIYIYSK